MLILLVSFLFCAGYLAIALEHWLPFHRSGVALLLGVLIWSAIALGKGPPVLEESIPELLISIGGILFFLTGAMTIVEVADSHKAFDLIVEMIPRKSLISFTWVITWIAFFLSSLLDNLTTTILMVTLLQKTFPPSEVRKRIAGLVVISANAGGAWTPIGDVTTTMLWIGGQITPWNIVRSLFIPSFLCVLVPLLAFTVLLWKESIVPEKRREEEQSTHLFPHRERWIALSISVIGLISVPIFKYFTHLPPFFGVLLVVGILWFVTDWLHKEKDEQWKESLSVMGALHRIDLSTILFLLGILLAVAGLENLGILHTIAEYMEKKIPSLSVFLTSIGVLSAVVDNVPLTAACQGMFPLSAYPPDHFLWEFLAYAVGTGGSILVIGSAAGVVAMGMEKLEFFWYFRKVGIWALFGYFAGILAYNWIQ